MEDNNQQNEKIKTKSPLDNFEFIFLLIVIFFAVCWLTRYSITPGQSGASHAPVYKLDRWTGTIYVIYADGSSHEVIQKN